MKKIVALVVLALAGVAAWYFWETRPKPDSERPVAMVLPAPRFSASFNTAVDTVLQAYFGIKESLVAWDSAAVKGQAMQLAERLSALELSELNPDTIVLRQATDGVKKLESDARALEKTTGLEQSRRVFHRLSGNMYALLRDIKFNGQQLYLQECPMAFEGDETANWVSDSAAIRNPYLGLHHPKYKGGMLECGELKDSLVRPSAN